MPQSQKGWEGEDWDKKLRSRDEYHQRPRGQGWRGLTSMCVGENGPLQTGHPGHHGDHYPGRVDQSGRGHWDCYYLAHGFTKVAMEEG